MLVDFSFIFMGFIFIFFKLYMCRVVVCGEWWMGWWCLLIVASWWCYWSVWLIGGFGVTMGGICLRIGSVSVASGALGC